MGKASGLINAKKQIIGKLPIVLQKLKSKALLPLLLLTAEQSQALVDDRLAGEGTGKALGINDPILGGVIIGVFTVVWSLYYSATKDLGGQREEDGLGL